MTITEGTLQGLSALTLDGGDDGIRVTFVPGAGMVACSLEHRGEELLGQRGGLEHYISDRSTMGIPLLYPWANRLASWRFRLAGRELVLDGPPPARRPARDEAGLPIHGLLAADQGWQVEAFQPLDGGGALRASLDYGARPDLLVGFPFPHLLRLDAVVAGPKLTVATTVVATSDVEVPVAFGFHPYLSLPGVDRADWEIEVPVERRLLLDERMLPTGALMAVTVPPGPLGARTFDDGYLAPEGSEPFVVSGGGRRIALRFEGGYPYAQVYAPADDDVIAFEPMTAPTNALFEGGPELPVLAPGERYEAAFSIEVS
ncbi:MAG TPA: aldose 1-epimerase [Thermoleophilaceae bacterium]|jgi:galactose mutarotase-like enzyme